MPLWTVFFILALPMSLWPLLCCVGCLAYASLARALPVLAWKGSASASSASMLAVFILYDFNFF